MQWADRPVARCDQLISLRDESGVPDGKAWWDDDGTGEGPAHCPVRVWWSRPLGHVCVVGQRLTASPRIVKTSRQLLTTPLGVHW